jgi:HK97 family phage major capsid protein
MFGEAPAAARFNQPPPPPEEKVTVTMTELKGIIGEAIKGMELPQIAELKTEIDKVNRGFLVDGDGRYFQTGDKSIIDTSVFTKEFPRVAGGGAKMDGEAMANHLRGLGGPWVKLSPVMEKFAKVIAAKGDPYKLGPMGIDINAYNDEVRKSSWKDADTLTRTDAGALVPTEFLATVIEFANAQSAILPKLWRIPMNTQILKIPKLVQAAGSYFGGITLYHPGEAVLKTKTKPSFDTLTFTAKKLIGAIALSDELIADSSINILNYLTGLFVRAFQYKIEGEVIGGTGLNDQMLGILNDPAINVVARTTVGTVKYDDLINMESALDENFQSLTFLSRRATVNTFRKQKDTVGQPVYHDGITTFLGSQMPPQLLGYPVVKTRNVPALGVQGDLILGDLGFYIWGVRQEMTIDTSRDALFFTDETAVRFVMRMDGAPGVSEAFVVLDNVPES